MRIHYQLSGEEFRGLGRKTGDSYAACNRKVPEVIVSRAHRLVTCPACVDLLDNGLQIPSANSEKISCETK